MTIFLILLTYPLSNTIFSRINEMARAGIMIIAPQLLRQYPMNEDQQAIVSHKKGPLLVIAGPGSGKTRSLTLLAMNLLLCGNAQPSQLVLCTYTEKAAYEMQDRIMKIAKGVEYREDLSQLRIGTIHSICNQFITEHLHHTPLGNNYETLDQFTQRLLIFEHIDEICLYNTRAFFQERWGTKWKIAKKLQFFFDKIVEELIFDKLKAAFPRLRPYPTDCDTFRCYLTHAYRVYQKILERTNRIDFAHLQKCAYNLLKDPSTSHSITKDIRYVLVDEYQDTNYIQEQILTSLASATGTNNFCVVGDEDQALYRFRGATVRNILEFANTFPECKQVHLMTNYRSHPGIINLYNRWMTSIDWSNPGGTSFRTEKTVRAVPGRKYYEYPPVLSIVDVDVHDEAEQFAEIVSSLKKLGRICDYNQVALLLHSVRSHMSDPYIEALKRKGIPAFCPRARTYFAQEEVCLMIGCFARIVGYQETRRNDATEQSDFPEYIRDCDRQLVQQCQLYPTLEKELQDIEREIFRTEEEKQIPRKQLADYFYRLVFTEPFAAFLKHESKIHNLVIFSQWLKTFQNYYRYTDITWNNLEQLAFDLFHTFFCLLYEDGINQFEDPQQPFPKGHVQIMTMHQAKGLEFPVVAVGRLDKLPPLADNEDRDLQDFYHQRRFEPENRIPAFDLRRLYYVAFSRAKSLLILTANKKPHPQVAPIWQEIPAWPYVHTRLQNMLPSEKSEEHTPPKPRYSFTNHIQMYTTCPRQFQFLREYNFMPARSVEAFSGLLIHQTLERIHRIVLDGGLDTLDDEQVQKIFERTFDCLKCTSMRPLDAGQKEKALHQVLNYFHHNYQEMYRMAATELNIQVEKDDYVLTGKIDLLMRGSNGLEVLDFKTRTRPENNSDRLTLYKQQLYLYAYALERRTGQLPKRLLLYWTAEDNKEDAIMEVPYKDEHVRQVSFYFDDVVAKIKQQKFDVIRPPEPEICKACDIRHLCMKQGVI